MKKLLSLMSLILLAACGEKGGSEKQNSANILENLTYSVDTVMVDSGDELINLSMGLYFSDVSADSKTLYQFTPNEHSVTLIDLDNLKIVKKISFEKEGPNGFASFLSGFKVLPDEKFLFSTFQSAGIFNTQSIKLEDITLIANEHPGLEVDEGQDLNFQISTSTDGRYLYSLPGGLIEVNRDLAMIDRSTKSAKMIDIPALDNTGKFSVLLFSDGMVQISMEDYYLDEYHGYLYLSSSVTSDMYRYNFQKGSMQLFSFPITVSPKEKTEYPKTEVSSIEEQRKESQKVHSQITFKNLMWDESRKLFFKIGSITKPSDSPDGTPKTSVFLYAFDNDLKLVGETLINSLKDIPEKPFFKDGKLWSYVNVEDELGFAVFTFDF